MLTTKLIPHITLFFLSLLLSCKLTGMGIELLKDATLADYALIFPGLAVRHTQAQSSMPSRFPTVKIKAIENRGAFTRCIVCNKKQQQLRDTDSGCQRQCQVCKSVLPSLSDLSSHYADHQMPVYLYKKILVCMTCNQILPSYHKILNHYAQKHGVIVIQIDEIPDNPNI